MAQIINQDSIGKKFGTGLGSSFASGLETLVQHKLDKMHANTEAERNVQYLVQNGYSPHEAVAIAHGKPHISSALLKNARDRQTSATESAEYNRLTGGATGQTQPGAQLEGATRPGTIRPPANMRRGDALKYAEYNQKERSANLKRYQKDIETVRDKGIDAETKLGVYNKLKELNNKELTAGPFGVLTEDGKLYESLLNSVLPRGISKHEEERVLKGFPTLDKSARNRQLLLDKGIEQYEPALLEAQIAADILDENDGFPPKDFDKQFKKRLHEAKKKAQIEPSRESIDGVSHELSSSKNQQITPQSMQPDQVQMQQQQPESVQGVQGVQPQSAEGQAAPWTQEDALQGQPGIDALEGAKYLGGRTVKGGVQGLTGLATLLPNIYRAATGNEVPGLETANKLGQYIAEGLGLNSENAPTETLETIGNIGENAASMLGLGGVFGAAAKGANAVSKGAKLSQWTNSAAKALQIGPKEALKVAGIQEAGRWMGKKLGLGEAGQAGTSIGATVLASILQSRGGLNNVINNLEKDASKLASELKPVTSIPLKFQIGSAASAADVKGFENIYQKLSPFLLKEQFNGKQLNDLKNAAESALQQPGITNTMKDAFGHLLHNTEEVLKRAATGTKLGEKLSEISDLKNASSVVNRAWDWSNRNILKRADNRATAATLALVAAKTMPEALGKATLRNPKVLAALSGAIGIGGEMDRIIRMSITSPAFRKYTGDFYKAVALGDIKEANKALTATDHTLNKFYPELKNK